MEDALKDQTSVHGSKGGKSAKLLRYPLRSASKSKEDKLPASSPSTASASASRRGKPTSSVSQSVSVLDISAKENSAKPPRRLSIPNKSTVSPAPKLAGYITPVSEARANRPGHIKTNSDTPGSDVARSLSRRKFIVLSSASYWLSQIKISETAANHQVSLGFFKLALEANCENVQLLRDELKSYACRHNLVGESAKEVFQCYGIQESIEQLQVSETCSHVPEEGTKSLDDDAHSLSSATGHPKLKPRSLNSGAGSAAKETSQKNIPVPRVKAPMKKKMANQSPALEAGNDKMQKNSKKPIKQEPKKETEKVKMEGTKHAEEEGELNPCPEDAVLQENKENRDAPAMAVMTSLEA